MLLDGFLDRYCSLFPRVVRCEAVRLIREEIRCLHGERAQIIELQDPEDKWYAALSRGTVDFSVYDSDYYFTDLWACWVVYSRKYLRSLAKTRPFDFTSIKSVLDLGCGIGYTTAALKQLFPHANVSATNIRGTKQWIFCKSLSRDFKFKLLPDISKVSHVDLVFASEYFEHIELTLTHLREVIALKPKFLVIANAFNTRSLGHFTKYENKSIDQLEISKHFNTMLKTSRYEKLHTGFWNNRPAVFFRSKVRSLI